VLDMRVALGRQAATVLRLTFLLAAAYLFLALIGLLVPDAVTNRSFVASLVAIGASGIFATLLFPRLLSAQSEELEKQIIGDHFDYQTQLEVFGAGLSRYLDAGELAHDVAAAVASMVRVTPVEVAVFDAKSNAVRLSGRFPENGPAWEWDLAIDGALIDRIVARRRLLIDCRRGQERPAGADSRRAGTKRRQKTHFAVGIGRAESPVGVILVGGRPRGRPLTAFDGEILSRLGEQVGYALDRISLNEQIELTERHRTLGHLARGLNHDLNNLLMPIAAVLQDLDRDPSMVGRRRDILNIANTNVKKMREYIYGAQLFGAELEINAVTLRLSTLLEAAKVGVAHRASERQVNIVADVPAMDSEFFGDRNLIERMLTNLMANAVDASESGQTVTISGQQVDAGERHGSWVRFMVVDRGRGIPAENLQRIFEPYYTTKDTGNEIRGSGLGLTIVEKVVVLHGGEIKFFSEVGKGTTAQVDLPLHPRTPKPEEAA
jgi:signal transduction histidine kinase